MSVRLLPGVDRDGTLNTLKSCRQQLDTTRSAGSSSSRFTGYYRWVTHSVFMLRLSLPAEDIDRLILTRRYWLLQGLEGQAHVELPLNLLNTEVDDRVADLDLVIQALKEQIDRWSRPGRFVVTDTSCYIKADKLETWDLEAILEPSGDPVHLLIPMVVIDELDRLKDIKDRHTRWRAGYTLAVLDRVLSGSTASAPCAPQTPPP